MKYPISEQLALQGGELKVPLLEKGKFIYVAIPSNTKDLDSTGKCNRNETKEYLKRGAEIKAFSRS